MKLLDTILLNVDIEWVIRMFDSSSWQSNKRALNATEKFATIAAGAMFLLFALFALASTLAVSIDLAQSQSPYVFLSALYLPVIAYVIYFYVVTIRNALRGYHVKYQFVRSLDA